MDSKEEYVRLKANSYRIKFLTHKTDEGGPILVFLHDALGSIEQWKNFPEQLANACSLNGVIIERQGHGKSSPFTKKRTKTYLHGEAHSVLPKLMKALGIEKHVLVGHSDGGSIALLYASKFVTSAVISIAAHVFVEQLTLESIKTKVGEGHILKMKLSKYHGDKTSDLFDAWAQTWLSDNFRDFNVEKELKKIRAPVFIVQSENDEYGTMKQVTSILENVNAKQTDSYLPKDGGHAPHLKDGEKVVERISEFLSKLE